MGRAPKGGQGSDLDGTVGVRTRRRDWVVRWHTGAHGELQAISDTKERVAIAHVIEKLQVEGQALRSPHQSAVMGRMDRAYESCAQGVVAAAGGRSTGGWLSGHLWCSRSRRRQKLTGLDIAAPSA